MVSGNKKNKRYSNVFTVRVNENNRITITKAVAEKFRIKQGDIVTVAILEITKIDDIHVVDIFPKNVDVDAADYDELLEAE